MKEQDKIFFNSEGDGWYQRNKDNLGIREKSDWVLYTFDQLNLNKRKKYHIVELGCSNGYRLNTINNLYQGNNWLFSGLDASKQAIINGQKKYSRIQFYRGLLSEIPITKKADIVIINFVLHWIDRRNLTKCISEIDRILLDEGYIILGDFLPDYNYKRKYHHLPNEIVYTYKQNYANIFTSLGFYKTIYYACYDHDESDGIMNISNSDNRGMIVLLKKSYNNFYKTE
ncbi:MAG: class I SAM-dependent methyltransferase [Spirochaetia bacterium]|nr:class I SAM-dependent methyltransferase [Spirochaetia bacterium]